MAFIVKEWNESFTKYYTLPQHTSSDQESADNNIPTWNNSGNDKHKNVIKKTWKGQ